MFRLELDGGSMLVKISNKDGAFFPDAIKMNFCIMEASNWDFL